MTASPFAPAVLAAYELNGRPVSRAEFYAVACNPGRSVAVEACAGAGKTWMLVSRMVRALLAGSPPQDILAITFTRKAAGEMRHRLDTWLGEFAQATPERLQQELLLRGLPAPEAQRLAPQLGQLHAQVLMAGRPVQIRTFHSWFAALLRTAPLSVLQSLGLPSHYTLLEDDHDAVRRVWRRLHATVVREPSLHADFAALVAAHGRHNARKALHAALSRRTEFTLADEAGVVEASVPPFHQLPGVPAAWAELERPELALDGDGPRQRWLAWAQALGRESGKTAPKAAAAIELAWAEPDLALRLDGLRAALFVKTADRLTAHLQKFQAAQEAEAELQTLCLARRQHQAWLYQQRMTRLTRCLIAEYAALKRENGWVDMNDVERAAHVLLGSGALSGWVQEKLDARVRHLLIDEFQDTNPLQWQSLNDWLSGYVGLGGGQTAPSVFIVGDPKQSIYRFRRAEPQVFRAAQAFVRDGLGGDLLSCDHTRRNAPAVIEVVNQVMAAAQTDGSYQGFRRHTTESAEAGAVYALPPITRDADADTEAGDALVWRDSLCVPRIPPEETLRTLECRQAALWLAERMADGLQPQEVMVLSRRRERLGVMEEELRRLHIPTQQPEKNDLAQAPEVQDLIALLDVLVSPAHDLSLARALKSPLLGASDDDLVALARLRRDAAHVGRSWLELLLGQPLAVAQSDLDADPDAASTLAATLADAAASLPPTLQQAASALRRYQPWVASLPPHDALAAIYHDADVLARYAAATPAPLRGTVLANLRALLSAALEQDGGRYLTPYALVRAFRQGGIAAPMTADAQAVRLLTIHGAKGLEADVVVLLDSDAAAPKSDTMGLLVDWPGESPHPLKLVFLVSEAHPPPCAETALATEQAERGREELNALYVAMTRARHTLALSAIPPRTPNPGSAWQRIAPLAQSITPATDVEPPPIEADVPALIELPDLPQVTPLPSVLTAINPDPIVPIDAEADDAPSEVAPDSLESRIGQAMHWLLETWVPGVADAADGGSDFAPQRLHQAAQAFVLDATALALAVQRAQTILSGQGAWAWDASQLDWQGNEVELNHRGRLLRLDRLVHRTQPPELAGWWVLDYKSAASPEQQPALLAQLRRYRSALQLAYPRAPVYAAFLTGDGTQVQVDSDLSL